VSWQQLLLLRVVALRAQLLLFDSLERSWGLCGGLQVERAVLSSCLQGAVGCSQK
jgi:hypothetical protein